jgi:eukaryotic-like serine/threonine-protein kinase
MIGPYQVQTFVGAGGMGEVYKAHDTRLNRTVAIKVLPVHLARDPQIHERFEREARVVAALNHPNICTLYDIGSHDGIEFLVMELLEGETLAARLQNGPLSISDALECASQIASAFDKAHRAGIIHRDLKPANVMLTKSGPKLLDFGIAKQRVAAVSTEPTTRRNDLTDPGVILGTAPYMAPEQVEGKDADRRTDLFAFGSVLYEMCTGKKPFDAPSRAGVVAALSSQPPPVMQLRPDIPAGVDYVIGRCLAKDPDDRWQTARDLLAELQRIKDTTRRSDSASSAAQVATERSAATQSDPSRALRSFASGSALRAGMAVGRDRRPHRAGRVDRAGTARLADGDIARPSQHRPWQRQRYRRPGCRSHPVAGRQPHRVPVRETAGRNHGRRPRSTSDGSIN